MSDDFHSPAVSDGSIPYYQYQRQQTWKRVQFLVGVLLKEMQEGMSCPESNPKRWETLFGSKQSMVANLHKLVATLGSLPDTLSTDATDKAAPVHLSEDEIEIMKGLLERTPKATR